MARLEHGHERQRRRVRALPEPGRGRDAHRRRTATRARSARRQSDPAWVAIFCGHEIQINDHQATTPQKTGSIYNFSPLNATQAKVQPRGTWVDYEIKVVGQTYTIIRNGEVLQTFENTPGKQSSRSGDPSTTDRQFTRGYVGLQNHSDADVIDYRNVRVLSLDAGSVRGPVTVEGNGAHTVEYRSTDVAGNVEATKKVDFTIGAAGGDTDRAGDHAARSTRRTPGAGGTYNGQVSVQLSATDPAQAGGGGGDAEDGRRQRVPGSLGARTR